MTVQAIEATTLVEATASESALRRFLHGLPGVDQVGAEARVADLGTRSIKKGAKLFALDLAVRMTDLTTLEGAATPGKVRSLCAKGLHPDPSDPGVPAGTSWPFCWRYLWTASVAPFRISKPFKSTPDIRVCAVKGTKCVS